MSDEVHCLGCHKTIHRDRFRVHRESECTKTTTDFVKCDVLKGLKCDMPYKALLAAAPEHHSDEFLKYLRSNNTVVEETVSWLVIENIKYHTPEKPWYTAFFKPNNMPWWECVDEIYTQDWSDWAWLIKAAAERSVKRFHIHIHQ